MKALLALAFFARAGKRHALRLIKPGNGGSAPFGNQTDLLPQKKTKKGLAIFPLVMHNNPSGRKHPTGQKASRESERKGKSPADANIKGGNPYGTRI
ncbi:MAG: hypothetical protein RSH26_08645 [Clostridia bacterium]